MKVQHHVYRRRFLGLRTEVHIYGHWGTPIMAFPSSYGRTNQFADYDMVSAVAHHIHAGRVKVFCVDGADSLSFYNFEAHPGHRAWMCHMYDRYIMEEVVPHIHHDCGGPMPITTVGCSFGAYHAMNFALKYPWTFNRVIALSGRYDVRNYFDGYYGDNVFYNNPVDFIGGMPEGAHLHRLRHESSIRLVCAQGAFEKPQWTWDFSALLHHKGIPHWLDMWGHDAEHHWYWWKRQFDHHLHHL
jgi:esterase/lipase superfamily enzyme